MSYVSVDGPVSTASQPVASGRVGEDAGLFDQGLPRAPDDAVVIEPEFRDLVQPLQQDELRQLEENLLAKGCRDPLVRWEGNGLLLDGYHRHRLCTEHGIPFRVVDVALQDRESAKLWILQNQLGRRNLTDDQRAAMAHLVSKQRIAISKRDRSAKGASAAARDDHGQFHRSVITAVTERPDVAPVDKPRERTVAAKAAKVSERKVQAVADVEKVKPQLVREIVAGKLTIAKAKEAVKAAKRQPEALAESSESTDTPTDELGEPLPDVPDLRRAFEDRAIIARALSLHSQFMHELNKLWGTPAAASLAAVRPQIEGHCKQARYLLRSHQPHALCPECSGLQTADPKCGKCRGLGWLTAEAWKRHEEATKARSSGKGAK